MGKVRKPREQPPTQQIVRAVVDLTIEVAGKEGTGGVQDRHVDVINWAFATLERTQPEPIKQPEETE